MDVGLPQQWINVQDACFTLFEIIQSSKSMLLVKLVKLLELVSLAKLVEIVTLG